MAFGASACQESRRTPHPAAEMVTLCVPSDAPHQPDDQHNEKNRTKKAAADIHKNLHLCDSSALEHVRRICVCALTYSRKRRANQSDRLTQKSPDRSGDVSKEGARNGTQASPAWVCRNDDKIVFTIPGAKRRGSKEETHEPEPKKSFSPNNAPISDGSSASNPMLQSAKYRAAMGVRASETAAQLKKRRGDRERAFFRVAASSVGRNLGWRTCSVAWRRILL